MLALLMGLLKRFLDVGVFVSLASCARVRVAGGTSDAIAGKAAGKASTAGRRTNRS